MATHHPDVSVPFGVSTEPVASETDGILDHRVPARRAHGRARGGTRVSATQHPPSVPQVPIDGGRDAHAMQSHGMRRLEARAAGERRLAEEVSVPTLADLTTPPPTETTFVDGQARPVRSRLRATLDAVWRRPGQPQR